MPRLRRPGRGMRPLVLLLLAVGAGFEAQAQDRPGRQESGLRKRLLEEAPKSWAKLRQFNRRLAASATLREVLKDRAGKVISDRKGKFSIYTNDRWERQDYSFAENGWTPKSLGVGPSYEFAVAKTSADSPYSVFHIGEPGEPDGGTIRKQLDEGVIRGYLEMPWGVFRKPLSDLFRDPAFEIKALTPVARDGESLVRLEFDWLHPEEARYPVFVGGSILLAPDDHWAAREYDMRTPLGPIRTVISYDHTPEGVPIPRKIETTTRYGRYEKRKDPEQYNGYVETTTVTFDEYEHKEVPAETFTLSAFGLPERQPGTNGTAWLLIAAGVAATAVSLYLLHRRRTAA